MLRLLCKRRGTSCVRSRFDETAAAEPVGSGATNKFGLLNRPTTVHSSTHTTYMRQTTTPLDCCSGVSIMVCRHPPIKAEIRRRSRLLAQETMKVALNEAFVQSVASGLNAASVPCVLWGHSLMLVHGIPIILGVIQHHCCQLAIDTDIMLQDDRFRSTRRTSLKGRRGSHYNPTSCTMPRRRGVHRRRKLPGPPYATAIFSHAYRGLRCPCNAISSE